MLLAIVSMDDSQFAISVHLGGIQPVECHWQALSLTLSIISLSYVLILMNIHRFMIGTEDGSILSCNKAKGQGDRISATLDGEHGLTFS